MSNPGEFNAATVNGFGQKQATFPSSPEKEIGGVSAMLIAELFNLNPRLYRVVERLLAGDNDSALSYLQREIATSNGR